MAEKPDTSSETQTLPTARNTLRRWLAALVLLIPISGLLWVSNWFYQRSRLFSVTNIDLELGEPELPWGKLIGDDKARELFGDPVKYHLPDKTLTPYQIGILGSYTGLKSLQLRGVTDDDVRKFEGLTRLEHLTLHDSPITDSACETIGQLENLQHLLLGAYYTDSTIQITDDGLRHLSGLNQLRGLEVHAPRVTDEGLKTIAQIQTLESLFLDGSSLSGEGLSDLPKLRNLQNLQISNWSLSEHALDDLPKLDILRQFSLWQCTLSENCLRPIGDCDILSRFSLEGSRLSENLSLQPLGECQLLSRLHFENTNATDAMLEDLMSVQSLTGLYLNQTNVSREAALRFHQSHPNVFMTDATGRQVD